MSEMGDIPQKTMTIIANGQPRAVYSGSTIADLLNEVAITPTHVVVQLDGMIIARSEFTHIQLQEGSKLEIVTLVGGG
jgi:sulfur carrier protein